ncbi:MAG: amidohydrolase family protein [Candidatus Dadabacteria bacterium]
MKKNLLLLLLLLFTKLVFAQPHLYLVKAGKLFDSEGGVFLPNRAILVSGARIDTVKEISALTTADYKKYTEVIDLLQYAVTPGLIDAHTHLLNREVIHPGDNPTGMDMAKVLTLEGDAYRAIYGTARAKAFLENGITAVQDLGNSGQFTDIALRNAIYLGLVPGPRMSCSGPGLSSEGGQLPGLIYKHRDLVNDEYRIVKGVDDAIQAVRENITQGADVIKVYANNTPNNTMLSIDEMTAIVKEAHRYGVRVTAHATNNSAVYNAVMAGIDGIEHGYSIEDSTLDLMAKRNVVLVPTLLDSVEVRKIIEKTSLGNEERQKHIGDNVSNYIIWKSRMLQNAIRHKVTIVNGSDDYVDFGLPMGTATKYNMVSYVQAGMPLMDVLQSATSVAAKHLRWKDRVGVIKKGAFADIVAFDANLDKDINALFHTHFVMKNGQVYVEGKKGL